MPVYEYQCQKCGNKFEMRRGLNDIDSDLQCPKCGTQGPKRVFSIFCTNQPSKSCTSTGST